MGWFNRQADKRSRLPESMDSRWVRIVEQKKTLKCQKIRYLYVTLKLDMRLLMSCRQDSTKELTVVISYVAMLLLYIIDLI